MAFIPNFKARRFEYWAFHHGAGDEVISFTLNGDSSTKNSYGSLTLISPTQPEDVSIGSVGGQPALTFANTASRCDYKLRVYADNTSDVYNEYVVHITNTAT